MNVDDHKVTATVEIVPPPSADHLCYVRCNFCNTVLAVALPYKRLLDTVTVKCGHCSNLSFLSTRPPFPQFLDHPLTLPGFCSNEYKKGHYNYNYSPSSSTTTICGTTTCPTTSTEPLSPKTPFVVKPPEKKHRLPSAYNRFMKEEIQRIKAANPEIPHREAFSAAAKNWARYIPSPQAPAINSGTNNVKGSDFAGMKLNI